MQLVAGSFSSSFICGANLEGTAHCISLDNQLFTVNQRKYIVHTNGKLWNAETLKHGLHERKIFKLAANRAD